MHILQRISEGLIDLVELEVLMSSWLLHIVRFLRILRGTKSIGQCISILRKSFCFWLRWPCTALVVDDRGLSVKHMKMVVRFRSLYFYHFRRFSIWERNHLVRDQVLFEGVGVRPRVAAILIVVLVSFRVQHVSDPNARIVCSLSYCHLVNPAEGFTMAVLSI